MHTGSLSLLPYLNDPTPKLYSLFFVGSSGTVNRYKVGNHKGQYQLEPVERPAANHLRTLIDAIKHGAYYQSNYQRSFLQTYT